VVKSFIEKEDRISLQSHNRFEMSLAQKHPRSPSPGVSGSPAKRMKLSDDSATMDGDTTAPGTAETPVIKDIPGVDQLGADMPNGGGVVKPDDHVDHGNATNGSTAQSGEQDATTAPAEPSDDEEEEEQPEAVAEEGIDRKDMYLDAVSKGSIFDIAMDTNAFRRRSHGRI
jgi:hypothetical protein